MAYASTPHAPLVEIIAHRGAPREHRENTLPSFLRAFELGASAVELDVHGTRDGAIVIHHDPTTNSRPGDSGPIVVIADSTLASLQAIAIGGERIPTLDELLAVVPVASTVYVEVKANGIEEAVVACIRSSGRTCAVHSFDHRIARRVHELAPDIAVGVLQTSYPVDPLRPVHDAGARDLWQHWELLDEALLERVHADGRRVIAWTVNDGAVARRLIDLGIDGICSDVPGHMRVLADGGPH
jgi:glycerophosphoryl diester phosphodiesterase